MFDVTTYGAVGDGSTDDTHAVQDAFTFAAAEGGQVLFPPGRYRVTSTIAVSGGSVGVYGPGATLVQDADVPALSLRGGWEWIETVDSYSTTSVNLSNGEGDTYVAVLTLHGARTVNAGDVFKLVSSEAYADVEGGDRRKGEFVVAAIDSSGTTVTLTGPLRDSYGTGKRLAKLKNVAFTLEGLTFDTLASPSENSWDSHLAEIEAARDVQITNVSIARACAKGLELRGLFGYTILGGSYANLRNEPNLNHYGYGVADTACEGGSISGVRVRNGRHGITTTTLGVATAVAGTSTDIELYGKSYGTTVDSSHGQGNSNAAFDTHFGAQDWSYANCTAVADYRGRSALGSGFQLRGERASLVNCRSIANQAGVVLAGRDLLLDNVQVRGASSYAVSVVQPISGRSSVVIRGGVFECSGASTIPLNTADVLLEDVTIRVTGDASVVNVLPLTSSSVRFRNLTIDMSGFTGDDYAVFFPSDPDSTIVGTGLTLIRGAAAPLATPGVVRVVNPAHGARVEIEDVVMDASIAYTIGAMPPRYRIARRITASTAGSSAVVTQALTGNGQTIAVGNAPDPVVYLSLTTGGGNRTLGALPSGFRVGQLLVIRSAEPTSATVTILTGAAYNTDLGRDVVLGRDQAVALVWANGVWVRMQTANVRSWIGDWGATGISAGTNQVMARPYGDAVTPVGWRAPRAGSITSIVLDTTNAVTAGRLSAVFFRNATTSMGDGMFLDASTGGTRAVKSFVPGYLTFAAGDVITIRAIGSDAASTLGPLAPANNALAASFEVEFG